MSRPTPKPWPRLSVTLPHHRHPNVCQACGGITVTERNRWQEHDDRDQRELIVVVLCTACSDRLIEPHPRLYRQLEKWEPWPGAMPLCVVCAFRSALQCTRTHTDLKANGGPGLALRMPPLITGFWDGAKGGKRVGGRFTHYSGPVSTCQGRTLAPGGDA